MYLVNNTRPDIFFAVSLLARFSSCPTRRHWKGVKHIFRYLQGTIDMELLYSNASKSELIGYAYTRYLSNPHKTRFETRYLFTYRGIVVSWRSMKKIIVATSSNHAEIIAIHEANRECVWLRSMTRHVLKLCDLLMQTKSPTILYEDNFACIAQLKGGYIKGYQTKHISPKFFFTHDPQQNSETNIQQIRFER